eukprot:scaffold4855_cov195-Amphora_coffeaeformis.AAC.20
MPPNQRYDLSNFDETELERIQSLVRAKAAESLATSQQVNQIDTTNCDDNDILNGDDWDNVVDLEAPTEADQSTNHEETDKMAKESCPYHRELESYIRKQSCMLDNAHRHAALDEARLSQAVKDAGFYAFGIQAVEVWVINEETGQLERPNGGFWISEFLEYVSPSLFDSNKGEKSRCIPGVGLAGMLWTESSGAGGIRPLHGRESHVSMHRLASAASLSEMHHPQASQLGWRDLKSLLEDPDTPKDSRFDAYIASGFGLAAGVPFETFLSKGIVLFLARSTADKEQIDTVENRVFLTCSAQNIGAVITGSHARRACLIRKQKLRAEAFRKVQHGLDQEQKVKRSLRSLESESSSLSVTLGHWKRSFHRRMRGWAHKCRGGQLQIPPPMTWGECFYTLLGCFVGLLVLSTMNELAMDISDNDLNLLIGPFGAAMTLLYGLSSAPASQPRNVILGQAVAGAISMSFTYIPDSIMSIWMRRAVGPAFAITAMVKLGIPHPPAGAHSVIYASGDYGWKFYFLVVLASMISVVPATLVKNLSEKRQYPTFWGYAPSYMTARLRRFFQARKEKNEDANPIKTLDK